MKIAILTAFKSEADFLTCHLERQHDECYVFESECDLYAAGARMSFDLLILGRFIADQNLASIFVRIRALFSAELPVLVLAYRDLACEMAAISRPGRADHIIVPVSPERLIARVDAMLGRVPGIARVVTEECYGEYRFCHGERKVWVRGQRVALTAKQYEFALLLFRNLSKPLATPYIRQVVWHQEAEMKSRTIDSHASVIRSKLNLRPRNGYILSTVTRYGYMLERLTHA
ncbi:response regulator transcription factor [Paraburkholderia xenovorans]|uniref:response regulator transcription factor n=1 Tax=Paraburkholderia xenovorans TaxID=36873 RepID=UPI0038B8895C